LQKTYVCIIVGYFNISLVFSVKITTSGKSKKGSTI